jgi:hypothetical protein
MLVDCVHKKSAPKIDKNRKFSGIGSAPTNNNPEREMLNQLKPCGWMV